MKDRKLITRPWGDLPITRDLPDDVLYQHGHYRIYRDPSGMPGDLDLYTIEGYDRDDDGDWSFVDGRRDFESAVAALAELRDGERCVELRKQLREHVLMLQSPASIETLIGLARKLRQAERRPTPAPAPTPNPVTESTR